MARYECIDCEDKTDDECVLELENEKNEKHPHTCTFDGRACNWECVGESE